MQVVFKWAKTHNVTAPQTHLQASNMPKRISLGIICFSVAFSVSTFGLPTGSTLWIGTNTAFAQTKDKREIKKLERIVKSAERKLSAIDRDLSRMEDDASRIRSSSLERTAEKIETLEGKLQEVDAGFDGVAQITSTIEQLKSRLAALSSSQGEATTADSAASSGGLSASDQRKVSSKVAGVERAIASMERSLERYLTEPTATSDRLGDRVVAGLEKAHEKLDELMQLAPDAASELQNSLAALEEKYDARAGENADTNNVSADASKRIDEMEASGEMDTKLDEINKLIHIATRFSRIDTDAFIFVDRDKFKTMLLDIQSWTDASSAFSQYMDENAAFLSTSRKANRLMIFSKQLKKEIVTANQNLAEFAKALPQTFDDHLQSVVEMASTAVETERFDVFGPLGGFGDRTIAKEMIWPTNWLAFYEALPAADAGAAKRLQASLTQTIATIDELKESARDKIIANNNLDPDAYVGADRDAILKLVEDGWRTIHGDADILEIRIPSGQWARTIGERWDKVDRMFVRVDFSIIGAYVVEEPVDGIATFWWVEVQKRHLEQDAMISDPASRHRHAPKPDQQIPADKL